MHLEAEDEAIDADWAEEGRPDQEQEEKEFEETTRHLIDYLDFNIRNGES